MEEKLSQSALWAVGRSELKVGETTYNLDCSGAIYAVCHRSGLEIASLLWNYEGNGVSRLFQLMEEEELIDQAPRPGDLIFWDNTYDYNGNGRPDDLLTHVGMVTSVDEDGLVHLIHHHYRLGIVEAVMDPEHPDDLQRNDAMRSRSAPKADEIGWTAGHLFRGYGRVSLLELNG